MEIAAKSRDGHIVLTIVGELDAYGAIDVDKVVSDALSGNNHNFLVDCMGMEYISSAGLGVFISHLDEIQSRKGEIVFYNMKEKVHHVFKLLGLDSVVKIVNDEDEALLALGASE